METRSGKKAAKKKVEEQPERSRNSSRSVSQKRPRSKPPKDPSAPSLSNKRLKPAEVKPSAPSAPSTPSTVLSKSSRSSSSGSLFHQAPAQSAHPLPPVASTPSSDIDMDLNDEGFDEDSESSNSVNNTIRGLLRELGAGFDKLRPGLGSGSSRYKSIVSGLRDMDDMRQLEALTELTELLSFATEDSLAAFPLDVFLPLLVDCLNKEHNPDVMLLSGRAVTHLIDVLPSATTAVVHAGAVPCFCAKLLNIEYIDLAEQSLQALEKISHEHPIPILKAGGLMAILTFLDFFPIGVQRSALAGCANICRRLPNENAFLEFVLPAVPNLTNLLQYSDQKLVESACLCFARLGESLARISTDVSKTRRHMESLAGAGLLQHLLNIFTNCSGASGLASSGQIIVSAGTYTQVVRLAATLCRFSPSLTLQLLNNGLAPVLQSTLQGDSAAGEVSMSPSVHRSSEQVFEILSFINALLPTVPDTNDIPPFQLDENPAVTVKTDFEDGRRHIFEANPELLCRLGESLFSCLLCVYASSASLPARHLCLTIIDKLLFFTPAEQLGKLFRGGQTNIASFIATLLNSRDLHAILSALGMVDVLMEKLAADFTTLFQREGVVHEIEKLGQPEEVHSLMSPLRGSKRTFRFSGSVPSSPGLSAAAGIHPPHSHTHSHSLPYPTFSSTRRTSSESDKDIRDPSKEQRESKERDRLAMSARMRDRTPSDLEQRSSSSSHSMASSPLLMRSPSTPISPSISLSVELRNRVMVRANALKAKFRLSPSEEQKIASLPSSPGAPRQSTHSAVFDKLKAIASGLLNASEDNQAPSARHADALLSQLKDLLLGVEGVSTFELTNSGIIVALLKWLAGEMPPLASGATILPRLRLFSEIFMGLSGPSYKMITSVDSSPFVSLVRSLQGVLSSLERLPIITHELPGAGFDGSNGLSGLRILTHPFKLRLQQLEPTAEKQVAASGSAGASTASRRTGRTARSTSESTSMSTASSGVADAATRLAHFAHTVVLIEPLATIGAIEDFLLTRLRRREDIIAQAMRRQAGGSESARGRLTSSLAAVLAGAGFRSGTPASGTNSTTNNNLPGSDTATPSAGERSDALGALEQARANVRDLAAMFSASLEARRHADASGLGSSGLSEDDDNDFMDDDEQMDQDMDEDEQIEEDEDDEMDLHEHESADSTSAIEDSMVDDDSETAALRALARHRSASDSAAQSPPSSLLSSSLPALGRPTLPRSTVSTASTSSTVPEQRYKISIHYREHPLPSSMTVFQAIQKYRLNSDEEADEEEEIPLGTLVWEDVHTLQFQIEVDNSPTRAAEPAVSSGSGSARSAETLNYDTTGLPSLPAVSASLGSSESSFRSRYISAVASLSINNSMSSSTSMSQPDHHVIEVIKLLKVLDGLNKEYRLMAEENCESDQTQTQETTETRIQRRHSFHHSTTDYQPLIAVAEFVNQKLNAKLMRQLQDPLTLCSNSFPLWCRDLVFSCPFLFTFEARRIYFQSTSFGISRALHYLQQRMTSAGTAAQAAAQQNQRQSENRVGRLHRQKVRLARNRILDSAIKVMDLYGAHRALLEIEYFGEVGTGLGPTLEFYASVSHELQTLPIWREDRKNGLFPAPLPAPAATAHVASGASGASGAGSSSHVALTSSRASAAAATAVVGVQGQAESPPSAFSGSLSQAKVLQLFTLMGQLVAKALVDDRLLDLPLSVCFWRMVLGQELVRNDLTMVDQSLGVNLQDMQRLVSQRKEILASTMDDAQKLQALADLTLRGASVADLCLDFTLPGYPQVELVPGGADMAVTLDNLEEYIERVVFHTLTSAHLQAEAFTKGFNKIFPLTFLRAFLEEEMEPLICGYGEQWDQDLILDSIKCDHGYSSASKTVQNLVQFMSTMSNDERRMFLKFVTGSPRLPFGGLRSLQPPLTVVRKDAEAPLSPDDYLPSVMTCVNYLKLPDYSSLQVLRTRLRTAVHDGQGSFHLS